MAVVGAAALASFLLPSSGYQLLKAAGGTAGCEVEAACPCFGDWCFQPPGWRWAQRGEIQVVRRWGGCFNGAQGGSSDNDGAGLKGLAGGGGRQGGERGRRKTWHMPPARHLAQFSHT